MTKLMTATPLCRAEASASWAGLLGERTAEQVLNGEYWWPDSPVADTSVAGNPHFVPDAFGKALPPGVHFSAEAVAVGVQNLHLQHQ